MKAIEELKASYEPVATLERVDIENETSETKERVELLEAAKTSDSKKSPAMASS